MLFDIFNPRVIPHHGVDRKNHKKDYSSVFTILASHSEIARPEYNYIWNSDALRSVEFSTKPKVVAVGCSITLGQGLPQDLRWSDILSKKIGQPIGNISYSGASINKDVSSFLGMVHQYEYVPDIVIANFANLERFYFIDGSGEWMRDWYINHKPKKTKASAPWDYEEILPYEWVYYQNLDHIKMLEAFCDSAGVKLIWSCWSNNLSEEQENFLYKNFKHYVSDPVRKQFPPDFEFLVNPNTKEELTPYYQMYDWQKIMCHKKYCDEYPEIFDHAYDYHKIAGDWGPGAHWPHPGIHKHLHWAEFYYNELNKRGWLK
jgi:hypothetical protein